MDRIDFGHMLERRRFTVAQWLKSELIDTMTQFKAWCFNHASEYVFTEKFLRDIEGILNEAEIDAKSKTHVESVVEHMETVIPQESTTTKNAFVELPVEEPKKKNKKESVNNPPKED
jgi:hypothetical protein